MNNYDISSTGENIDFCVFYDTSLAQIYFDDWLNDSDSYEVNKIDLGGRDNHLYLIGDADKPYYLKSELNKLSKNAIFELWFNYDLGYNVELNDYKKAEYIADLMQVTIKQHYKYLASQYGWYDIQNYIPHDCFVSRGYNQGDAVLVANINGLTKEYKKYIDNLFWDCPIYIRAEINGREFYEDDFLSDNYYEWDKDEVKAKILSWDDVSDYAKNWIIERLPDYPDYS